MLKHIAPESFLEVIRDADNGKCGIKVQELYEQANHVCGETGKEVSLTLKVKVKKVADGQIVREIKVASALPDNVFASYGYIDAEGKSYRNNPRQLELSEVQG